MRHRHTGYAAVVDLAAVQQAAVQAFSEQGFAATGIRDIAQYAGVTSGALYHYTRSKEDILVEIMRRSLDELVLLARAAVAEETGPPSMLARLVSVHVATQAASPRTARVIDREYRSLSPDNGRTILQLRDSYESYWREVLQDGRRDGTFQVTDTGLARLALLEMCNGVTNWYRPGGPMSLPELRAGFVRLAFGLVGSTVPSEGVHYNDVDVQPFQCEPRTITAPSSASAR